MLRKLLRLFARNKLSVFLFHKVPESRERLTPNDVDIPTFERLLDFIQTHYEVLPLSDAVDRLKQDKIGSGAACITFDDGYSEWLPGVVPLLQRRSLPATFFITTGPFQGTPMWHERLLNVVRSVNTDVLDTAPYRLPPLSMSSLKDKQKALQVLEFHFKYLPLLVRDQFLSQLEEQLAISRAEVPTFSPQQLREISSRGFDIGSHTLEHPILSLCETAKAREEIGVAKEILEGIIKNKVTAFAYPNGHPYDDFGHQHIAMVREAGYRHAVTTQWGAATCHTPVFQIPRFTPWGPDSTHMSLQVIRNLLAKPEYIQEVL